MCGGNDLFWNGSLQGKAAPANGAWAAELPTSYYLVQLLIYNTSSLLNHRNSNYEGLSH